MVSAEERELLLAVARSQTAAERQVRLALWRFVREELEMARIEWHIRGIANYFPW